MQLVFNTVQNAKTTHLIGLENTAIPHLEIEIITEISQEKLSNTAIPQAPMSFSLNSALFSVFISLVIKTKSHNHSINKVTNLGYDR